MTEQEAERNLAPTGGFEPDLACWEAWSPEEIARRLTGVRVPWYVAGGWALDLFLGGAYRDHEDLEIAVPHDRFPEVAAALPDLEFFVVGDGLAWPLDQAGSAFEEHHQTWALEPETGRWRVDVFRESSEQGRWVCRRDARIQLPYDHLIVRTAEGIPYGRPEVILLFKAKAARPKDEADLAAVLPLLEPEDRDWLAGALEIAHPGHQWLATLQSRPSPRSSA